jgi:hypothetical protein
MNNKEKNELLQRIARYLMLHGSFCNNIGLLNGKTGIAVFFYHYARYTKKRIYDDFAGELFDEIYKDIHVNIPVNFKDGLCGIAWGVEYLIRNKFVEGNSNDILEDLDKRIMEWDVRRITDCSLETGLSGIACNVISRMENREKYLFFISQDYICDLIEALKGSKKDTNPVIIEILKNIINRKMIINPYHPVFEIIDRIKYNAKKVFEPSRPLGIYKAGYSGIGLKLMEISTDETGMIKNYPGA